MYVNNELGNILNVQKVITLCEEYGALFHSDSVQAVGHFHIDLKKTQIDFISASAHKFHGPKGVGFAYFRKGFSIKPILFGGEQEKGIRAGTESVHSIFGMDKALQLSLKTLNSDLEHIKTIKIYFIKRLKEKFSGITFNGCSVDLKKSTLTILSVRFPAEVPFLSFNLDMKGIAVSEGSACQSGNNKGSHVLDTILGYEDFLKTSLRFSFNKYTSIEDIEYVINTLKEFVKPEIN